MPNHVTNIVKFSGNTDRIQEMLKRIQNDEYGRGTVDFNKIIPMPEALDIRAGSMTRRGLEAYQGFVAVYTLAGTRTGLDLLNIPQKSESVFLSVRTDIKPEEWALGKAAFQNIQKYGAPTWYEWCIQNWGTKWNAYDCDIAPDGTQIKFLSAWSAPHPILQKLSEMYPDIVMEHQWADGDLGVNCGQRSYRGGAILDEYYPDYGKRSVEFACQVMGAEPEDYGLVLSQDGTEYACAEETEEGMVMQ